MFVTIGLLEGVYTLTASVLSRQSIRLVDQTLLSLFDQGKGQEAVWDGVDGVATTSGVVEFKGLNLSAPKGKWA